MSNWFENNPTKSIISYTLVVAGSAWAVSTFVLQDNRLSLAKSELEAQKSLTEQYKSKVELLQRDIEALRSDNAEYRSWLGQTKDAVPAIVPRTNELKQQLETLKAASPMASASGTATLPKKREGTAKLGTAYIDEVTGLIFTVLKTATDRTASVTVKFPGKDSSTDATVSPGQQWRFSFQGHDFFLTVASISFVGDYVDIQITPAP